MGVPANDSVGRRSFSVVRTLGEGAFGSVFLADMVSAGGFKRRVALKLLNSSWDPESDAGRRLRDEARLLGRLQHRHIVRVDDLLQLGGRWALLMEYIPGLDVETLIARARTSGVALPVRATLQIAAATAAALDAAFAAVGDDGSALLVVHRDIKPSNVRLSQTGEVKVLDFGVARADFAGREAKTERIRYGSLGYMAPERVLGEPETAAGDVYALGVMLYEMLTLESYGRAELGPDRQAEQAAAAVARARAVLGPEAEGEVGDLLARALAYDGTGRPTAREVESVLRRTSARVVGDDVHDFAAANFGGLGGEVATGEPDPAEGMVLEEGTAALQMLKTASLAAPTAAMRPASQSPTLAAVDLTPLDADAEPPPPAPRAPGGPLVIGAILVGVLGLAALGWWALSAPTASPPVTDGSRATAPAAPPQASPPAPAPLAAAPAPAEAPAPVSAVPSPAPAVSPVSARPPTSTAAAAAPAAVTAPRAQAPAPAPSVDTPRLRAAKFVLAGAEGISVTCGDVSATGSTSALVREFPAGACSVVVSGHRAQVSLDTPRQVNCTLAGESLSCL